MRKHLLRNAVRFTVGALLIACSSSAPTAPATNYVLFQSLSASWDHTCALSTTGETYCWGGNSFGQLGEEPSATICRGGVDNYDSRAPYPCDSLPHLVSSAPTFVQLTTGLAHSCGRTGGGDVWCWGSNIAGQLGMSDTLGRGCAYIQHETASCSVTPVKVPSAPGVSYTSLYSSGQVNVAIGSDGHGWVWGDGGFLGIFTPTPPSMIFEGSTVTAFMLSSGASCAIYAGFWTCVDGTAANQWGTHVNGDPGFVSFAGSTENVCGLIATGAAYCWEANYQGQLGTGTAGGWSDLPLAVAGGHAFTQIALGFEFACGIEVGGKLYCWGAISGGGNAPVAHDTTLRFASISAGYSYVCGITTDQALYCLGDNRDGELGDATTVSRGIMARVKVIAQ